MCCNIPDDKIHTRKSKINYFQTLKNTLHKSQNFLRNGTLPDLEYFLKIKRIFQPSQSLPKSNFKQCIDQF